MASANRPQGPCALQTLLNSTGLNTSIRSENSFWMLLKRLVSIGALHGGKQAFRAHLAPHSPSSIFPGAALASRPGRVAGCIAALLPGAAVHREGPLARVATLGLANTLFIQEPHLQVQRDTARRPEHRGPPAHQMLWPRAKDALCHIPTCYESHLLQESQAWFT